MRRGRALPLPPEGATAGAVGGSLAPAGGSSAGGAAQLEGLPDPFAAATTTIAIEIDCQPGAEPVVGASLLQLGAKLDGPRSIRVARLGVETADRGLASQSPGGSVGRAGVGGRQLCMLCKVALVWSWM